MTATVERPVEAGRRGRGLLQHPDALEHVLVLLAATVWLLHLTASSGGFHDPRTATTAVAFLPALLATRPWQRVPGLLVVLTALTAAGALVVLTTTAAGWRQADSPADHVLGLLALLLVAGYARTPARRRAVLMALLVGLALALVLAWQPWWGSGNPNTLMTATFYWHNQLGAYAAALGLVAAAVGVLGAGRARFAGLVLAAGAAAVVVLTTSRISLALLVAGWLVLAVPAVRGHDRVARLVRWAALPFLAAALLGLLTSGLFFATAWDGPAAFRASATSAPSTVLTGDRGADSFGEHGADRRRWTLAALQSWADAPLRGDGFGSFLATSNGRLPASAARSTFVHDGYAESLASGGLVFGGPFLLACALVAVAAVRRLLAGVQRPVPAGTVPAGTLGAALGAGVLLAHSAVDFDWHYAALLVLLGVLGGLLLADDRVRTPGRLRVAATVATLGLSVALVVTATLVEHHGRTLTAPGSGRTTTELLDARLPLVADPRIDLAALQACLDGRGRLAVPAEVARRAVSASRRSAAHDPEVATARSEVRTALASQG